MIQSRSALTWIVAASFAVPASGQTTYKLPPPDFVAVLDSPPPPTAQLSPTRTAILLAEPKLYPSISELAQPILRLAGVRISPRAGSLQRLTRLTGLSVQPLDAAPAVRISLPVGSSVESPKWSHDGRMIAFLRDADDRVELWVADAATGNARAIAGARINDVLTGGLRGTGAFAWLRDNRRILAMLVPEGRGPVPAAARVPAGPNVQESFGRRSQMPTFPDLLTSAHDEDLFVHFGTSQLALVDTQSGKIERVGPPGLVTRAVASPDEKHLLVSSVRRPFSYRVPFFYFTRKHEVWDTAGRPVATIADLPTSDEVPRQGADRPARHRMASAARCPADLGRGH
jgi:dipeptidyl aminopeptidase/acylaminoacyl peptidase